MAAQVESLPISLNPSNQHSSDETIDSSSEHLQPGFSREQILAFLRYAKDHPEVLENDLETRTEILGAVRSMKKNHTKKRHAEIRSHDADLINQTENVRRKKLKTAANTAAMPLLLNVAQVTPESVEEEKPMPKLLKSRPCYICKNHYNEVHHFYDRMCPACAKFNFVKRFQSGDLCGRIALVTGARIKIGYEICLKLLRSGCDKVIATTRFPRDAALRFAQEPDFDSFKDRLDIYGLDLLYTPNVERFCAFLRSKYSHLDILINNAAMTLSRHAKFFEHLQITESAPLNTLPAPIIELMSRTEPFFSSQISDSMVAASLLGPTAIPLSISSFASSSTSSSSSEVANTTLFDGDGQLIDFAPVNSWKQEIEDVPTADLAQVMLINAMAPFVLVSKLKPMLEKSPFQAKFIINVSAMEGQFSRASKTSRHPHTNCAKASLNMMTRTVGQHYAESGIYVNSVDTGWCSEMLPVPTSSSIQNVTGEDSRIPLDEIDGAARVLDPIFVGLAEGVFQFGKFFKDYAETSW